MPDISVSKRKLWRYVNLKIKRAIHHYHVFSVITILFDEMINELKTVGKIKIHNFGILVLKELGPRKYFDVNQHRVMESKGHRILRFTLAPRLRKKIISHLDYDKKGD